MNVVHGSGEDAVVELGDAFHDPKVSFCCRAENLQGCLVSGAIVVASAFSKFSNSVTTIRCFKPDSRVR